MAREPKQIKATPLTKASREAQQEHIVGLKSKVDDFLGEIDSVLGYPAPSLS